MRRSVLGMVILLAVVALALAGTANALQLSGLTVRDTGDTIRYEYRLCDPDLAGVRFTLRFQLKTGDGVVVLDHSRRFRQRFACQDNFFFVTDAYEPGRYRGRVVAEPPDGDAVSSRWKTVRIRS